MIILASASKARKEMLQNAGLNFEVCPADLDEKSIIDQNEETAAADVAQILACEKALHVSRQNTDAFIIGSDQILVCDGQILSKAGSTQEAYKKLQNLRAKTHILISALAIAKNDKILWQGTDEARLTMHNFDDAFLSRYCDQAGDILTQCVGAYALEGIGVQLFEKIEGDYFTILGMPLLMLLNYLREEQGVCL